MTRTQPSQVLSRSVEETRRTGGRRGLVAALALALALLHGRPAVAQQGSAIGPTLPEAWRALAPASDPAAASAVTDAELAPGEEYAPNRLLVRFQPSATAEDKKKLHARYRAKVVQEIPALGIQVLELPDDAVAMVSAYQAETSVVFAEPDYIASIYGAPAGPEMAGAPAARGPARPMGPDWTPNDPLLDQQWHHATIGSAAAWDKARGTGVVVAVNDTGVDCSHPDLQGKCLRGYDFVSDDTDPRDDHGHGTHVAGLVAAVTNNAVGGAGSGPEATVLPVKVLGAGGSGNMSWIASGVTWAADNGVQIINMSLGGRFTSSALRDAIAYAVGKGVTVIAAAGNESTSNPSYPAAYPGVISVAATDRQDRLAEFSNYGDNLDVSSPGVGILSTVRGGSYQAWNGTSMAAPIVSGVAALLKAQGPCRSPQDIENVLESTAKDLGSPGWDRSFGAGRIQADRALSQNTQPCGGSGTPAPTQPPLGPTAIPPRATATPLPTQPLPDPGDTVASVEALINRERAAYQLQPLALHAGLRKASQAHALDLALTQRCSHDGTGGTTPESRMLKEGLQRPYGEIVACGQASPEAAVQAWMGSSGHRAIILCASCRSLGAGYQAAGDGFRRYWVVTFAMDAGTGGAPTAAPPTATAAPPVNTPAQPPTARPTDPPVPAPGGGTEIELRPLAGRIGWVVSTQPYGNNWGSSDTFTGVWNDRVYHGAMQFDLAAIPRGMFINYARLTVYGRTAADNARSGTWTVNLLDGEVDPGFEGHGYSRVHSSRVLSTLLPLLGARDVDMGRANIFNFGAAQLEILRSRVDSTGLVTLRMDGPTSGDFSNLVSWDSGVGDKTQYPGPVLYINYSSKPIALPTATSAPADPTADPGQPQPTRDPVLVPPTATPLPQPTRTPTQPLPPTPDLSSKIIELVAAPGDVGYVKEADPRSYLGSMNTYTGFAQALRYNGIVQFDLSSLPKDRVITGARLTLTGQSTQRLSKVGNGIWEVNLLSGDVDAGWAYHGYKRINDTQVVARMDPKLVQADLDAGRDNVFIFRTAELKELAWRSLTTGKVSFRFDGPRNGQSNVFDWDAGHGGNPPRLTVITGPPTADNPLPPAPPRDPERMAKILDRINAARGAEGLRALKLNDSLTQVADRHVWDMSTHRFFDHRGSDGSSPEDRVAKAGFAARQVKQLIAGQNGNADLVANTWLSNGETAGRILTPELTHIGVYYDYVPGSPLGHYWVVVMAEAQ